MYIQNQWSVELTVKQKALELNDLHVNHSVSSSILYGNVCIWWLSHSFIHCFSCNLVWMLYAKAQVTNKWQKKINSALKNTTIPSRECEQIIKCKRRSITSKLQLIQGMNSPLSLGQEFPAELHLHLHPSSSSSSSLSQHRSGLLGEQNAEAFLQHHSVSGELVVWRESSRVGRAGGLPLRIHLLQSVDSVPVLVQVILQKHLDENWLYTSGF